MEQESTADKHVVVIGGGPAGLTAAYELVKYGLRPIVLEKDIDGGRPGPHRELQRLPLRHGRPPLLYQVARKSRRCGTRSSATTSSAVLVCRGSIITSKFFIIRLKPLNTLKGLGFCESILILLSYLRWQLLPYRQEDTFEQWVTNRFGKRLFQTFFKTYTEKVWGIPCSELKAEWAAQRIKDLSLKTALLNMFVKPKKTIKTLIEEFDYPRLGPGMMWNAVQRPWSRNRAEWCS